MSLEFGGIDGFRPVDSTLKKAGEVKKKAAEIKSERNDTERDIPLNTYIPGMPIATNTNWEATRETRRDNADVSTVQDAITQDRIDNGFGNTYTFKAGDTVYDVAESCRDTGRYGDMSVNEITSMLLEHNSISDPTKMQIGQVLELPPMAKTTVIDDVVLGDDIEVQYSNTGDIKQKGVDGIAIAMTDGDGNEIRQTHNEGLIYGATTGDEAHITQNDNKGIIFGQTYGDDADITQKRNKGITMAETFGDLSDIKQINNEGITYGVTNGDNANIDQKFNDGFTMAETFGFDADINQYKNKGPVHASTEGNKSSINQDAEWFGAGDIYQEAHTKGYEADITQDGAVWGDLTEQHASTTGWDSNINQYGNVFGDGTNQTAETMYGDVSQRGNTFTGKADQYGSSIYGDVKQYNDSFGGAKQEAEVRWGDIDQHSTVGQSELSATLEDGAYNKATQKGGVSSDELTMINANDYTVTEQNSGMSADTGTYHVKGSATGQFHEMVLGSNNDHGNLSFDAGSSKNEVVIRGGDKAGGFDARQDTFDVKLDGENNTVHANPGNPFMSIGHSDTLNLDIVGNYEMYDFNESGYQKRVVDTKGNQVLIGGLIKNLNINGKPISLK